MAGDCIFCKIAAGDIPGDIIVEDEHAVAFRDINPQAPTHILVIPRTHIGNASMLTEDDDALIAHLMRLAGQVARDEGVEDSGYRIVLNVGAHGGESVPQVAMVAVVRVADDEASPPATGAGNAQGSSW